VLGLFLGGSISLVGAIETRSLPSSLAAAHRGFTFYLADPSARLTTIALGGSGEPPLPELGVALLFAVAAGVPPAFRLMLQPARLPLQMISAVGDCQLQAL